MFRSLVAALRTGRVAEAADAPVIVHLDRDSVAMGDDVESHATTLRLPANTTLDELLRHEYRLASIAGGKACWVLFRGAGGEHPLGVWAQQWHAVRLLDPGARTVGALATDDRLELHVAYFTQLDLDWMFELLQSGITGRSALTTAYYARLTDDRISATRKRAASVRERLLPADAIAALETVGASTRAHSDTALFLTAAEVDYEVRPEDHGGPMLRVSSPAPSSGVHTVRWAAWFSHPDDVARMLLGAIGEHARALAGRDPYPWAAPEQPLGEEAWPRDAGPVWIGDGAARRADFLFEREVPEPFARIALLPLEPIVAAYTRA